MAPIVAALRAALRTAWVTLANPGIRRLEAAWLLGYAADSAVMVTITLSLWGSAGAVGVALLGAARMVPATAAGLLAAVPLARWRGDRILVAVAAARAGAALAALGLTAAGASPAWLLIVAGVLGAISAIVRPVHNTALPTLARSPEELVAGNVATSTAEAVGTFAGPAAAAVLLATGLGGLTGAVSAAASGAAILALAGIRYESVEDALGPVRRRASAPPLVAGLAAVRARPVVALTMLGFLAQVVTRGVLNTLLVVASLNLLGMGDAGLGVLGSALGVGGAFGLIAGLVVGGSSPRRFLVALAAWGAPIALIALVPVPAAAFAALAVTGLANAILDIVGFTMIQRGSANAERGGVFAILETLAGVGTVAGSLLAPALLSALGDRGAILATGALLPAIAVVLGLAYRGVEHAEVVASATIARLRAVPVFAPLPMSALERLAHGARPRRFDPGAVLMAKGEPGDTFLLIREGRVEIDDGGRVLDSLGPGAGIGEIALLRDGVRTATARALTVVEADEFDAATFRSAIAGPMGSAAAECLVVTRLARSAPTP